MAQARCWSAPGRRGRPASRGSQSASRRRARASSSPESGASSSCPSAAGPARIVLAKRSSVDLDQAHGTLDHRPRTAVVGDQVDTRQTGQGGGQVQHPAHIRQAPGIDRLVVVADEEDVAPLAGKEHGQVELRAVDVLDLVDEQRRAALRASAPAAPTSARSAASARRTRSSKSSASLCVSHDS